MSFAAARQSKRSRYACQSCRDRKARFSYRGAVRADRDHTLCFECYRSERERQRARLPLEAEVAQPVGVPLFAAAVGGPLGDRQLEHRRAMLTHQERNATARGGRR